MVVAGAVVVGGAAGYVSAPPATIGSSCARRSNRRSDPLDYRVPLAGFRHYTKQVTDDVMFTVDGLQQGDVIRLATLDSFTGKLWNVTGPEVEHWTAPARSALVGRNLPAPDLITAVKRDDVTFRIVDYADVWVPGVGYRSPSTSRTAPPSTRPTTCATTGRPAPMQC